MAASDPGQYVKHRRRTQTTQDKPEIKSQILDHTHHNPFYIAYTFSPRIGMFCTLDGQAVRILEVVYDEASGEIDEIYLEKALE